MIDYFDASVLAALLLSEPTRGDVDRHLATSDEDIMVSDFVVAEVSSAISRLVRMDRKTTTEGRQLLENLDDWIAATPLPIEIEGDDIRHATDLVRDFALKLRAPDALHIAICQRIEARLVTLDINMARAARAAGVACINPAESAA